MPVEAKPAGMQVEKTSAMPASERAHLEGRFIAGRNARVYDCRERPPSRGSTTGCSVSVDTDLCAEIARRVRLLVANEKFIEELWGSARELFMPDHPWFKGIVEHRWTREQIVLGEIQHYLRVRTNPIFFGYIVTNVASERNYALMEIVMENFMEELGGEKTHVDIMLQMLDEAGIAREQADEADAAPGTLAAIEMIRSGCQNRSALEGISLLAFVEAMHGGPDGAAARVYKELTGHYGFSRRAAATYELHAEQDTGHGDRQIAAIREYATTDELREKCRRAVRLGLEAFNFEWDGHVQAMTGQRDVYWSGKTGRLALRRPEVLLPTQRLAKV
ncbi:MAG: iron-containing redox enzyme family protein [Chloroflexi bacterium]|nr:MAG: iron-containing redox enzyme family protein [Chloroflexota bacterium]